MKGISFRETTLNLCFALMIVALAVQLALGDMALADRRLNLFLEKYEKAKDRLMPMGHEDSPFYRYHDRRFEEGLDAAQLKLLRDAQEKGDCIRATLLMEEGFLHLYPFLRPAFQHHERHAKLAVLMSNSSPPETARCHYHSGLKKLFTRRKRNEFPPVNFTESHPKFDLWKEQGKRDPDLGKLRLILGGSGDAAFCDDYSPSIADLRAIVNRPGGLALTPEEELFLLERARMYNLPVDDYDETVARLKRHFSSNEAFLRMRDASRRGKLVDIPFPVDGYWQKNCRFVARFRREAR